jgi:hypothetical protein
MATITGKGVPKAFEPLSEGEHVLHITDVKGLPKDKVSVVTMKMLDENGQGFDKYPQKYELSNEGGYAAFYWLVKNGLGVDLNEGDEFDIDDLEDAFVTVEIIHKPRENGGVFANIRKVLGPGTPFGTSSSDDDDDE